MIKIDKEVVELFETTAVIYKYAVGQLSREIEKAIAQCKSTEDFAELISLIPPRFPKLNRVYHAQSQFEDALEAQPDDNPGAEA